MSQIKTHKLTGQKLLLKRDNGTVSTLFVLDNQENKILSKDSRGKQLLNVNLENRYKMAVCLNTNLI